MTISVTGKKSNERSWQGRGTAGWLALAAAPTFALMAWISAFDGSQAPICSPAQGILPINSMACMYLLMSFFHLSPWLKRGPAGRQHLTRSVIQSEGD
jgi:hypothetical protein